MRVCGVCDACGVRVWHAWIARARTVAPPRPRKTAHFSTCPLARPPTLLPTRRYDVDNSNSLEKPELFVVMREHGMALGDSWAAQEAHLEAEFRKADRNKSGSVDYEEFVDFYTRIKKAAASSGFAHQRAVLRARKERRVLATQSFLDASSLVEVLRGGDVALLSARWLLRHAGYESQTVERGGRKMLKWSCRKDARVRPLPCRQALERDAPAAFMSAERVQRLLDSFATVVADIQPADMEAILSAPIVVASHGWQSAEQPDPRASSLRLLAAELARQMPQFAAWGYDDVGVFFDWSCVYQDTLEHTRSAEQDASAERAIGAMALLYGHKQTTVLIITDVPTEPPRGSRGWPLYEECLTRLFKVAPPPKRFTLDAAGPVHMWNKTVRLGADVALELVSSGQGAPLAPSRFISELASKVLTREADRPMILADYRQSIEHGFSGLERLSLSRRGWGDAVRARRAPTAPFSNPPRRPRPPASTRVHPRPPRDDHCATTTARRPSRARPLATTLSRACFPRHLRHPRRGRFPRCACDRCPRLSSGGGRRAGLSVAGSGGVCSGGEGGGAAARHRARPIGQRPHVQRPRGHRWRHQRRGTTRAPSPQSDRLLGAAHAARYHGHAPLAARAQARRLHRTEHAPVVVRGARGSERGACHPLHQAAGQRGEHGLPLSQRPDLQGRRQMSASWPSGQLPPPPSPKRPRLGRLHSGRLIKANGSCGSASEAGKAKH